MFFPLSPFFSSQESNKGDASVLCTGNVIGNERWVGDYTVEKLAN